MIVQLTLTLDTTTNRLQIGAAVNAPAVFLSMIDDARRTILQTAAGAELQAAGAVAIPAPEMVNRLNGQTTGS